MVLEWARENPTLISEFLRRMGSDINFQKFYRHVYDPLRHCYRRIFNCEALTVVFMEGVLLRTLRYKHAEEAAVTARVQQELRIRQSRVAYLQEMIDVGDDNHESSMVCRSSCSARMGYSMHGRRRSRFRRDPALIRTRSQSTNKLN